MGVNFKKYMYLQYKLKYFVLFLPMKAESGAVIPLKFRRQIFFFCACLIDSINHTQDTIFVSSS